MYRNPPATRSAKISVGDATGVATDAPLSAGGSWAGDRGEWAAARTPSGPGGGGSGGGAGSGDAADGGLLSDRELRQIEKDFADGMTAVQIVHIFGAGGGRFSRARLGKNVRPGWVGRSRRVGRKGLHQGSLGLYPATTVRRINGIKRLMAENYTIEAIQKQFLRYRDEIEIIERGLETVLLGFEEDLGAPHFDAETKKSLKKELAEARLRAEELLKRIEGIERRVIEPHKRESAGGPSTPGGAEDLL